MQTKYRLQRDWSKRLAVFLSVLILGMMLAACSYASPGTPTPLSSVPTATATKAAAPIATTPVPFTRTAVPAPAMTSPTPVPTAVNQYDQANLAGVAVQVYVPTGLQKNMPAQVLIALHGMKGTGLAMSQSLVEYAEQYRWVILAPTFDYNPDWQNPEIVANEDPKLAAKLNDIVFAAKDYTGLNFTPKLLLYGFSRGAQLAHRYALMYPERSLVVATVAAGGYTLPFKNVQQLKASGISTSPDLKNGGLSFPFGVGDIANYTGREFNLAAFQKVVFWVEVGDQDNKNEEAPRAYDPYIGLNRLERGNSFYHALKEVGVNATFTIYPGVGHAATRDMSFKACKFFKGILMGSN